MMIGLVNVALRLGYGVAVIDRFSGGPASTIAGEAFSLYGLSP